MNKLNERQYQSINRKGCRTLQDRRMETNRKIQSSRAAKELQKKMKHEDGTMEESKARPKMPS